VKLTIKRLEWDEHLSNSSPSVPAWCMATAIAASARMTGPFTSDLSGQDSGRCCILATAVEMVMGPACTMWPSRILSGLGSVGRNVELENVYAAMYERGKLPSSGCSRGGGGQSRRGGGRGSLRGQPWLADPRMSSSRSHCRAALDQEIAPEKIDDPIMVLSVND